MKCCTLWRGRPSQTCERLAEPDFRVVRTVAVQKKCHECDVKNERERTRACNAIPQRDVEVGKFVAQIEIGPVAHNERRDGRKDRDAIAKARKEAIEIQQPRRDLQCLRKHAIEPTFGINL